MTRIPLDAERCNSVASAIELMHAHDIRHVPVMSGVHLVGIVSERDILQGRITHGKELDLIKLEDVCQRDVLSVHPLTPVDEVARRMLGRKVGSAVVVDGDYVVGIFTTNDALRVLRDLFTRRPHKSEGGEEPA